MSRDLFEGLTWYRHIGGHHQSGPFHALQTGRRVWLLTRGTSQLGEFKTLQACKDAARLHRLPEKSGAVH